MTILAIDQVKEIAGRVAAANLGDSFLNQVLGEDSLDSDGVPALRLTLVVKPGFVDAPGGEAILDTAVALQLALQREGDERFAYVGYATQAELERAAEGDED
jgi:hypothetical protein